MVAIGKGQANNIFELFVFVRLYWIEGEVRWKMGNGKWVKKGDDAGMKVVEEKGGKGRKQEGKRMFGRDLRNEKE